MTESAKPPKGADAQAPHVLLVDDDPDIRKVFSLGLEKRGFQVIAAGTAGEALKLAEDPDVQIDVIIMDIVLPDSWGSQVAMEQTLFRPETKVIYISGYSKGDAVLGASSINEAVDFLPKPFTVEELAAKIREVLSENSGT
jgi:two-component system, cell cycle sensor histidine kinase and response regulator CckA